MGDGVQKTKRWPYLLLSFVDLLSITCMHTLTHARTHIHTHTHTHRFVYVWDTVTQRILYKLPGHLGTVNDVDFHPNEPICKFSVL